MPGTYPALPGSSRYVPGTKKPSWRTLRNSIQDRRFGRPALGAGYVPGTVSWKDDHIQALGKISKIMTSPEFRARAYAAQGGIELFELFREAES